MDDSGRKMLAFSIVAHQNMPRRSFERTDCTGFFYLLFDKFSKIRCCNLDAAFEKQNARINTRDHKSLLPELAALGDSVRKKTIPCCLRSL